ncbi:unnamed protein product [Pleuronectes platessa]|uniref:Uncharacterized protein n=1 Tax=Pleuronectes platessa TaxID=8262 RepID=A0A9N7TQY2_PLEPL|nr:unnamed protein product [Pleuronectes platessa]
MTATALSSHFPSTEVFRPPREQRRPLEAGPSLQLRSADAQAWTSESCVGAPQTPSGRHDHGDVDFERERGGITVTPQLPVAGETSVTQNPSRLQIHQREIRSSCRRQALLHIFHI